MKTEQMQVNQNATYTSNNPCFPGQLFHVTNVTHAERFSQPNQVIEYERWAWPMNAEMPYLVERTKTWLYNAGKPILGLQLPDHLQLEFNQTREAVLTVQDMMS